MVLRIEDLQLLKDRLLACASASDDCAEQNLSGAAAYVSLDRLLRFWKLGSVQSEAAFLVAVLEGEVAAVNSQAERAGDLRFRVPDVEKFREQFAIKADYKLISVAAASRILGTSALTVHTLLAAGHFSRDVGSNVRLRKESVDRFLEKWQPLSAVARELGTCVTALYPRVEAQGMSVMQVRSVRKGCFTHFLSQADARRLLERGAS